MAARMDQRLVGWKVVAWENERADWKDYMMADR